jgi:hypothetical protein
MSGDPSTTTFSLEMVGHVGNGGPRASSNAAEADPLRLGDYGPWVFNQREYALRTGGNVYLAGARAYFQEVGALDRSGENPSVELVEEGIRRFLRLTLAAELQKAVTRRVNTELLGETKISGLGCEDAGGEPLVNDGDYSGRKRKAANPSTGPFEDPGQGSLKLRLW